MRRTTTDHRSQGDDGVKLFTLGHAMGHQWQLERAWSTDHADVAFFHAIAYQGINGAGDQAFHHKAVKTTHHQCELALWRNESTFKCLHVHFSCHSISCLPAASSGNRPIQNPSNAPRHQNQSCGCRYSITSRSKPEMALKRIGLLNSRILRTPRSRKICDPAPTVL